MQTPMQTPIPTHADPMSTHADNRVDPCADACRRMPRRSHDPHSTCAGHAATRGAIWDFDPEVRF